MAQAAPGGRVRVNNIDLIGMLQAIRSDATAMLGQLARSEQHDTEHVDMATQAVVQAQTLADDAMQLHYVLQEHVGPFF